MGNHSTRSLAWPKAAAVVAGLGVAAALALAAPVRAASPSTPAARLVEAQQHHRKPGAAQPKRHPAKHHTARHSR